MIDTHCHIYEEYYDDITLLIDKIKKNGINKVIINGCDMKSNLEVLELVKKYDIVYGALGFHPTEEHSDINECMDFLEKHLCDKKIVAVGEIGLDYHYDNTDKEKQIDIFKRQLDIASRFNKPVIVHTRDSLGDTYNILSMYKLRGSIHAYSGSLEMAKKFINLGYLIGIGGVCTFKNAKNIVNVIENINIEYILLETDSPYLTPVPFRGQINTPINLIYIAKKISELKNINYNDVKRITNDNAIRLFDISD